MDTHTITVKRDSMHPFPQNIEFPDAKNAYSIPATKLLRLIPPIILPLFQRETRGALSEVHWIYGTVISPPPDQSLSHLSEKHELPLYEVNWFYRTPYQCSLRTSFPERRIPLDIPPTL